MDLVELEQVVKNLDHRMTRIEHILPTLATKEDLKTFATKEDLKAFATREELREEGERTRQHFNAVTERLEGHIRLIAEWQGALQEQLDDFRKEVKGDLN